MNCAVCQGSRICFACHGSKVQTDENGCQRDDLCHVCDGAGTCMECEEEK